MTFDVQTSDVADADIQTIFLSIAARDPDFAGRWLEGLLRSIQNLDTFPTRHARATESDVLRQDVRRMLYRNGRAVYRVLFSLIDTDNDGQPDVVRVLRVLHGVQRPLGAEGDENA